MRHAHLLLVSLAFSSAACGPAPTCDNPGVTCQDAPSHHVGLGPRASPPLGPRPQPEAPLPGPMPQPEAPPQPAPLTPKWAVAQQQLLREPAGTSITALPVSGLAVGPHGHSVLGGTFAAGAFFETQGLPESQSGAPTPYLAHYALDGTIRWVRSFAPGGTVRGVAVDYADQVLASGRLDEDVLLARLGQDGSPQWAVTAQPGPAGGSAEGGRIAIEGSNHVILSGTFSGEIVLGGERLRSKGAADVLLARVDPTGAVVWARSAGTAEEDEALAVAVSADGDISVLTRTRTKTVDRWGATHCLSRYHNDGRLRWSRCFETEKNDLELAALTVDGGSGAVLVAGRMAGTVDLGGGPLKSAGRSDAVVARYAPDGSHVFSRRVGGAGEDAATGLSMTRGGDIVLSGRFAGVVNFGNDVWLQSDGDSDAFVALYDGSGGDMTARRFGGAGADLAAHVVVDRDDVLVSGSVERPADVGVRLLPSASSFLLRLSR